MNPEIFHVYILRTNTGSLYIGQTNNLVKRLHEHKTKSKRSAKYLRPFTSVELVYSEMVTSKSEALKREWELKQFSKAQKEALIQT